ncbi:hypothetical protein E1B28_003313 [Marasmius oreades]|uniref:Uncharacterized protein n=1 Tax=Marasmius oreades TaxID=181124 RepID=A0A9P7UJN6_9AGAR|nr:uncharacterized protein E1B28_003313 [Marasmius oreades]KAG7085772.1 hypothetical protein E1B28_003313 [Marasmius oreades]
MFPPEAQIVSSSTALALFACTTYQLQTVNRVFYDVRKTEAIENDITLKKRSRLEDGGLKFVQHTTPQKQLPNFHAMEHDPPAYTEEQILTIYEDLLSNPEVAPQTVEIPVTQDESNEGRDQSLLMQLNQRLVMSTGSSNSSSESLSSILRRMTRAKREPTDHTKFNINMKTFTKDQGAYLRILDNLKVGSPALEWDVITPCSR